MLKVTISCDARGDDRRLKLLNGKLDRDADFHRAASEVRSRLFWLLNCVDECNVDGDVELVVKVRKVER